MKLSSALASLVSVASALDLTLHTDDTCGGTIIVCGHVNPGTCCSTGSDGSFRSVGARNSSSGPNGEFFAYSKPNCVSPTLVRGACSPPGEYRSASMRRPISSRKRAAESAVDDESGCTRPDALILADGTQYDLSTLDDAEFDSL